MHNSPHAGGVLKEATGPADRVRGIDCGLPNLGSSELILAVPSRSYPHTFALYTEYYPTAPDKLGARGSLHTVSTQSSHDLHTSKRLYVLVSNIAFDADDELALWLLVCGRCPEEPE